MHLLVFIYVEVYYFLTWNFTLCSRVLIHRFFYAFPFIERCISKICPSSRQNSFISQSEMDNVQVFSMSDGTENHHWLCERRHEAMTSGFQQNVWFFCCYCREPLDFNPYLRHEYQMQCFFSRFCFCFLLRCLFILSFWIFGIFSVDLCDLNVWPECVHNHLSGGIERGNLFHAKIFDYLSNKILSVCVEWAKECPLPKSELKGVIRALKTLISWKFT